MLSSAAEYRVEHPVTGKRVYYVDYVAELTTKSKTSEENTTIPVEDVCMYVISIFTRRRLGTTNLRE